MRAFVVDVNVAIVANGKAGHADLDCVGRCIHVLDDISRNGVVVLDDGYRILSEYQGRLSRAGQPGVGDAFMKWVWENQAVVERCEQVVLTPIGTGVEDFAEFPRDAALSSFHRKDRKYVAAALASQRNPELLNAVDRGYWKHKEALERNRVRLRFLCPQHME